MMLNQKNIYSKREQYSTPTTFKDADHLNPQKRQLNNDSGIISKWQSESGANWIKQIITPGQTLTKPEK